MHNVIAVVVVEWRCLWIYIYVHHIQKLKKNIAGNDSATRKKIYRKNTNFSRIFFSIEHKTLSESEPVPKKHSNLVLILIFLYSYFMYNIIRMKKKNFYFFKHKIVTINNICYCVQKREIFYSFFLYFYTLEKFLFFIKNIKFIKKL